MTNLRKLQETGLEHTCLTLNYLFTYFYFGVPGVCSFRGLLEFSEIQEILKQLDN